MKKIVMAAAALAMAASFASAEATFSVNYRTGMDVLSHTKGGKTSLFNASSANRATEDALSFKGKADFGGLELEIDPGYKKGNDAYTELAAGAGHASMVKYNAWINFGSFMIKSGTWDARAVGRVNGTMGNHEGPFYGEISKPGTSLGTLGKDISQQNGKKAITTMVQYKKDALEVRGAMLDGTAESFAGAADAKDDWNFMNETWMAEVGYTVADFGRVMVTYKGAKKDNAFALFLEPNKVVDGLTSLVGVTYEMKDAVNDPNYLGVDLRAAYKVDDALTVTGMFNWTKDGTKDAEKDAFWAMANATYKLDDTFTPFCSVIYTTGKEAAKVAACGKGTAHAASLRIYPGVEIYNTKSANIITGVAIDLPNFTGDDDIAYKVTVPMLMRVKF